MTTDPSYLSHWADQAAERTLRAHPHRSPLVLAAGITPSGVVHIGNFREVITVDLVTRALVDRGVEVRFIYSWDDFDVFRKVPADLPRQEELYGNVGRSIVDVPDPYGEHPSYADHFIEQFQRSLPPLGIRPEFIRQHTRYRNGTYAYGIRTALEHREDLRNILNEARERHGAKRLLAPDWMPLAGFCGGCGRDSLSFEWDREWTVAYRCQACSTVADVDLRTGGNIKLPWRIDWPMRWAHERVCFEPGGKDHSSAGGSYDTASKIVSEVYGWVAPTYVGYDFVTPKGRGGKMSSSKGGAATVADCLEIYQPEVLRWLFAGYRPNTEFQISFDLDVIKIYEDYDRAVRLAHEASDGPSNAKKRIAAARTLHLADPAHRAIEPGSPPPVLVGFRTLSVVLQIFDGDVEGTIGHFERSNQVTTPADRDALRQRAQRVWTWIEKYAPDEFRYRIRQSPIVMELTDTQRLLLAQLVTHLESHAGEDDAGVAAFLKAMARDTDTPMSEFYPVVYGLLVGRDHGPRLSTLLSTMGAARALPLLRPSLGEAPAST